MTVGLATGTPGPFGFNFGISQFPTARESRLCLSRTPPNHLGHGPRVSSGAVKLSPWMQTVGTTNTRLPLIIVNNGLAPTSPASWASAERTCPGDTAHQSAADAAICKIPIVGASSSPPSVMMAHADRNHTLLSALGPAAAVSVQTPLFRSQNLERTRC